MLLALVACGGDGDASDADATDGGPAQQSGADDGADAGSAATNAGDADGDSGPDGGAGDGDDTADGDDGPGTTGGDVDCLGVRGGAAREDRCGECDTDPDDDCVQDCAGTWGGNARVDMCGTCNANAADDCVQDCAGTWGGNASVDMCGTCNTNDADDCVQDCEGTWGGSASVDMCGTCNTDASDDCVQDCEGTWGGAVRADCAGTCGGNAAVDPCGTCDSEPGNDCGGIILDVSTHLATPATNPLGATILGSYLARFNATRFPWIVRTPGTTGTQRYDPDEYIAQVLLGSDTDVGLLVGIPYSVGADGTGGTAVLTNEDLLTAASDIDALYPGRVLTSCAVMPNDRIAVQLAMMESRAADCHVWFTNTAYSAAGSGYFLHEGVGPQMLQKGIDEGRPIFLVEKGMPLEGHVTGYSDPQDVGPAARMFPDARIVVLHSAFEHGFDPGENSDPTEAATAELCSEAQRTGGSWPEGPYDPDDEQVQADYPLDRGVNSLIKSLRDANIGPNGHDLDDPTGPVTTHVYASLDDVWAHLMTQRHEEAMHVIGKLLLHVGEDRILWGTSSLWYGSPQPQLDAFSCFEISQAFQDTYGYPALTPTIKAKILGTNGAQLLSQLSDVDLP